MSETRPRDPYVIPFAIAMVALFLSIATSMWSLSHSRAATDALSGASAEVRSANPGALKPGGVPPRPGLVLKSASASVNESGVVTKHAGTKPTVEAVHYSSLQDILGSLDLPASAAPKGLWCLQGGPWSTPNIATKKSGGAFVVDSSHAACAGVFVASFGQSGAALPFTVDIVWADKG